MGDAGEGLIDADSRIQERLEELESARAARRDEAPRNPEALREAETLRLARAELERQISATAHERRRAQLQQAIAEVDRRLAQVQAALTR
jgi:chromosome segregation ATPase